MHGLCDQGRVTVRELKGIIHQRQPLTEAWRKPEILFRKGIAQPTGVLEWGRFSVLYDCSGNDKPLVASFLLQAFHFQQE